MKPRAGSVGALAVGYLGRQLEVILDGGLQPSPDGHVPATAAAALRRVEAGVGVFSPILEPGATAQLSGELAWLALLLGEVSAREALAGRLRSRLGSLPEHLVVGPVRADVEWRLGLEQTVHLDRLGAALHSERRGQLLAVLTRWRTTPPLARKADQPGAEVTRYVKRTVEDFHGQLIRALLEDKPDQASSAHRAARRVRYAAEVSDELGRKLTKSVEKVRRLEALLDDLVAGLHAAHFLSRIGLAGGLDGEHNGFTYGLLHEQELRAIAALRTRLQETSR